jgi:hypothetical protein
MRARHKQVVRREPPPPPAGGGAARRAPCGQPQSGGKTPGELQGEPHLQGQVNLCHGVVKSIWVPMKLQVQWT